jgi:hypothetical protein
MKMSKILLSVFAPLQLLLPLGGLVMSQPAQAIGWKGKLKIAAVVGAVGAMLGRYIYNCYHIKSIHDATTPENTASSDARSGQCQIYKWAVNAYPTAVSIESNMKEAVARLQRDWRSGQLIVFGVDDNRIGHGEAITRNDVVHTIDREMEELSTYLNYLRMTYARYRLDWRWKFWNMNFKGIDGVYADACVSQGLACDQTGWKNEGQNEGQAEKVDDAQAEKVDNAMTRACATQWYHCLPIPYLSAKPNYGDATQEWWRIFKLHERLKKLKTIVNVMPEGPLPAQRLQIEHGGQLALGHFMPPAV